MAPTNVILSAFADEGTPTREQKDIRIQLAVLAALGFKFYTPRFLDLGQGKGVQHVDSLDNWELAMLAALHKDMGFKVTSLGSRIGKVKLVDIDDGSNNKFVPFDTYMSTVVENSIHSAKTLGTRLIRGFSFYHPRGSNVDDHFNQAVDQIGQIADRCQASGLFYGIEIEPNLVGSDGDTCARLARELNHPNVGLVYDGGNIAAQNKDHKQCMAEFEAMLPHLLWMHVKDYKIDRALKWEGHVDEERLKNFVPCDVGDVNHYEIFRRLAMDLPQITERLTALGIPGFFVELEPHLKGGGQFGGYSEPDGMGIALKALCDTLDVAGLDYDLRTWDDLKAARGF